MCQTPVITPTFKPQLHAWPRDRPAKLQKPVPEQGRPDMHPIKEAKATMRSEAISLRHSLSLSPLLTTRCPDQLSISSELLARKLQCQSILPAPQQPFNFDSSPRRDPWVPGRLHDDVSVCTHLLPGSAPPCVRGIGRATTLARHLSSEANCRAMPVCLTVASTTCLSARRTSPACSSIKPY